MMGIEPMSKNIHLKQSTSLVRLVFSIEEYKANKIILNLSSDQFCEKRLKSAPHAILIYNTEDRPSGVGGSMAKAVQAKAVAKFEVKACAITFFALVMKFALITFDTYLREGIILGLHILNVRIVETKHPQSLRSNFQ